MNGTEFKNILVARGGALGDFILTLPVLAALRKRFPQARLEILGYPRHVALAQAAGLADAAHSIEAQGLARMFIAAAPVHAWFANFDLIISYLFDPEGILRENILRSASGATFVQGSHRPNENDSIHATEVFLSALRSLGIVEPEASPRLEIAGAPTLENRLAIHPGSGSQSKNWPEENWTALLELILTKTKTSCLLIGGEAEGDRLPRLVKAVSNQIQPAKDRLALAQNLPLVELAERLRRCRGFVGHDSGVTHLAAALGLPGVVLWGPSNEAIWRPRSDRMQIVRDVNGLSRLPVAEVFGKLTSAGLVRPA